MSTLRKDRSWHVTRRSVLQRILVLWFWCNVVLVCILMKWWLWRVSFKLWRFVWPLRVAILFLSFPDISKLSAIKDRLPPHVSYGHIKLVIAILELSCGAFSQGTPAKPQSERSFKSGTQPMKTSSKPAPASQETARKLPGWLSGKPGGKRKNPFWRQKQWLELVIVTIYEKDLHSGAHWPLTKIARKKSNLETFGIEVAPSFRIFLC